MEHIVVLVTASGIEEAEVIARRLLDKKLAACCTLVNGVRSLYRWQGEIKSDCEVLMVIKSRADMFDKIKETVSVCHSYTVPEIIALPITAAAQPYLEWLDQSLIS